MRVWYKRVHVHYHAPLPTDGPIIFASTHPNSAIDYLFSPLIHHQPTYVLVRGDVFEKKLLEVRPYEERMNIYPIPQAELFKNENLTQNTGW